MHLLEAARIERRRSPRQDVDRLRVTRMHICCDRLQGVQGESGPDPPKRIRAALRPRQVYDRGRGLVRRSGFDFTPDRHTGVTSKE